MLKKYALDIIEIWRIDRKCIFHIFLREMERRLASSPPNLQLSAKAIACRIYSLLLPTFIIITILL